MNLALLLCQICPDWAMAERVSIQMLISQIAINSGDPEFEPYFSRPDLYSFSNWRLAKIPVRLTCDVEYRYPSGKILVLRRSAVESNIKPRELLLPVGLPVVLAIALVTLGLWLRQISAAAYAAESANWPAEKIEYIDACMRVDGSLDRCKLRWLEVSKYGVVCRDFNQSTRNLEAL